MAAVDRANDAADASAQQNLTTPAVPQREIADRGRAFAGRLWRARSFLGGLIAIGLGYMGQQVLLANGDSNTAFRYYLAAIVVLTLSMLHPLIPSGADGQPLVGQRTAADATTELEDSASATTATSYDDSGTRARSSSRPLAPASTTGYTAEDLPDRSQVEEVRFSPWVPGESKLNSQRPRELVSRPMESVQQTATSEDSRPSSWQRWARKRKQLGLPFTIAGLVVTLGVAVAAAYLLIQDITNPLGGWLWAVAVVALLLTVVGAPVRPLRASRASTDVQLSKKADFFSKGTPCLDVRVELVLLALVLLVALMLRTYNLEYFPGVDQDEAYRSMEGRGIIEGNNAPLFGEGWYWVPNLYFYLVSFGMRIFGDGYMLGPRLVSTLAGMVTVLYVYRIGRALWGPRVGLMAGAMLAVSPLALQFSRIAGENTPTGALWAVGFFYLILALKHRRLSDWALAGVFWSFSLYFYAAGKLIIPMVAVIALYCLVRWRREFFREQVLGFLMLGLSFCLVFLPYGIFSAKDNWQGFSGRAREASIFAPQKQEQAFGKYDITFDPAWATEPLQESLLLHPLGWAQLGYQQVRVSLEVLNARGDSWPFYGIKEHNGSMLGPFWAVLTILGLAYAAWKVWDPRFGLLLIWFGFGLLGVAVMEDLPNMVRASGFWSVVMLFPAVLVDRVFAGAWPLSLRLARRWATLPIAVMLIYFGADSVREYFVYYPSMCYECLHTTQARYIQQLGVGYKIYEASSGAEVTNSFGQIDTKYMAKGVEGVQLSSISDALPITDNDGKAAAFIIYSNNLQYLPTIESYYPNGIEEPVKAIDGTEMFKSYKLSAAQIEASRTTHAMYKAGDGKQMDRDEQGLGTLSTGRAWDPPKGLSYPLRASWQGGLIAPAYGQYTFAVKGGGQLEIDDQTVVGGSADSGKVVLAKGMHQARLAGTLDGADKQLGVVWSGPGVSLGAIEPKYLYKTVLGGLSAEIAPSVSDETFKSSDPLGGQAPSTRRVDAFIGFREARGSISDQPFIARWQGKINTAIGGTYSFLTATSASSQLLIDGKQVLYSPARRDTGRTSGSIVLTAGQHDVDLRFNWTNNPSTSGDIVMEWYWVPPDGVPSIVPPEVLTPLGRSWTTDEIPDAPTTLEKH